MNLRLLLPGLLWFGAMVLVFITPIQDPPHFYFGVIPARAVIHAILFLGFTHSMIGALKKQLKHAMVRDKAILIVLILAAVIAIISESSMVIGGIKSSFCLWTLTFNMLGTFMGIGTFKLLYHSSC